MNVQIEDLNQVPREEEEAESPSRAWDLLRSMKEQRESLVERWKEGGAAVLQQPSLSKLRSMTLQKQRRRSMDGSSARTRSTASSTDASSKRSCGDVSSSKPSTILVPSSSSISAKNSSAEIQSSAVVESHERLPILSTLPKRSSSSTSRKNVQKRNSSNTIPRHIVSLPNQEASFIPVSPLSVSPVSHTTPEEASSSCILEEKDASHPYPRTESQRPCGSVPNVTSEEQSAVTPPQTPPRRSGRTAKRRILSIPPYHSTKEEEEMLSPTDARSASPMSLTSGSDDSSTLVTTSSDTSGWISVGESTRWSGTSGFTEFSRQSRRRCPQTVRVPHRPTALRRRPLFVTGRAADAQCGASGGHWSLAQQSGMPGGRPLDAGAAAPSVAVGTTTCVPLSTDFRCGAHGSLYDICLRSGLPSLLSVAAIVPPGDALPRRRRSRVRRSVTVTTHFPPAGGPISDAAASGTSLLHVIPE